MNRKQKIIVSVTGIFIVLLILVGLTYAYFLTRIQGNTNSKSISVTTADLKLTYGDGNGIITGEKIQPDTTLDTKTFTVTNEGNSAVNYAVVLEDVSILNATTSLTTEFESNDFVFTLLCTSSDKEKISTKKICFGNATTAYDFDGNILTESEKEVAMTDAKDFNYKNMVKSDKKIVSYVCDTNGLSKNTYKIYGITVDEWSYTGWAGSSYLTKGKSMMLYTTSIGMFTDGSDYIIGTATWDYPSSIV